MADILKPTLTSPPAAPQRGEPQGTFNTKSNNFVAWQVTNNPELQQAVDYINQESTRTQVNSDNADSSAVEANQFMLAAQAASTYVGEWENETGAGVVGGTYYYRHAVFMLKKALADITTVEPVERSEYWFLVIREKLVLDAQPTLLVDHVNQDYKVYEGAESGMVTAPYADILTFERGTGVTTTGRTGLVEDISVDKIAYASDPETGEVLGAQLSESAENLITWSEDLANLPWSPRGGSEITVDTSNVFNGIQFSTHTNTNTTTLGTYIAHPDSFDSDNEVYCASCFVKRGSQPESAIYMYARSSSSDTARLVYNFDSDTVSLTETGAVSGSKVGRVKLAYDVVFIYIISDMLSGSSSTGLRFFPSNWGTPSGIGSEYGYIGGAQLTKSSYPLPYIKTEGTTVATSADSMYRVIDKELNRNAFTMYSDVMYSGDYDQPDGTNTPIFALGSDITGTPSNAIGFTKSSDSNKLKLYVRGDNTNSNVVLSSIKLSNPVFTAFSMASSGVINYAVYDGENLASGTLTFFIDSSEFNFIQNTRGASSLVMRGLRYDKRHALLPNALTLTQCEQLVIGGWENVEFK